MLFKALGRDLGRPFAIDTPVTRTIDGFAVDRQPPAQVAQQTGRFVGDHAVRPRPNVEQQVAVLADNVHQVVHQAGRGAKVVVLDVGPRPVADRGVGLPVLLANVIELAPLDVQHGHAVGDLVLVLQDRLDAPFQGAVVIVGHDLGAIGRKLVKMPAKVEPQDVGLELVHELPGPGKPVLQEGRAGRLVLGVGRTIEAGVRPIYGVQALAKGVIAPVKGAVARHAEL